jgi:hypothetical protein
MRRSQLLGYSLLGLLVAALVGQGVAAAQAEGSEPAAPASPGLSKQVDLSPTEQLAQAKAYTNRMEAIRNGIRRDLEEARKQRDVVKTLCLNDKLNQVDVALRSATERTRSLELAVKRGDQDLANHEFTILSVLYQRAQQLDAEAKQCIGKEIGFTGESSVTMEVDPGLPFEDPTEYPPVEVIAEPPNCASCFR